MTRKFLLPMVLAFFVLAGLPACSGGASADLHMMSLDGMPANVQSAPYPVQQAYQFAAANPDLMQHIPCYCGCGSIGHTSNYSCYVSAVDDKGAITYDSHALGCSICVDITQDVMRLTRGGKNAAEIKAYVDSTYSKYGTSTMP